MSDTPDPDYTLFIDVYYALFQNSFPAISSIILENGGVIQFQDEEIELENGNVVGIFDPRYFPNEECNYIRIVAQFFPRLNFDTETAARRTFNRLQQIRTIGRMELEDDRNDETIEEFDQIVYEPEEEEIYDDDEKENENIQRIHNNNLEMLARHEPFYILSMTIDNQDERRTINEILLTRFNAIRVQLMPEHDKLLAFFDNQREALSAYSYIITTQPYIENVVLSYRGVILKSSDNEFIDNTDLFHFEDRNSCNIL